MNHITFFWQLFEFLSDLPCIIARENGTMVPIPILIHGRIEYVSSKQTIHKSQQLLAHIDIMETKAHQMNATDSRPFQGSIITLSTMVVCLESGRLMKWPREDITPYCLNVSHIVRSLQDDLIDDR